MFWQNCLKEHNKINMQQIFDEAFNTFFRNTDISGTDLSLFQDGEFRKIENLRARGIMVDMEEGVLNRLSKSPISNLFGPDQIVSDVSGCGNNFAVGFGELGPHHNEAIKDAIRKQAEMCDSLQSIFICNSMGGGTGSGVGSYILKLVHEEYPEVLRFNTIVFPGKDDDVVTAPYNSVLALNSLCEHSECVFPVDNEALYSITNKLNSETSKKVRSLDVSRKGSTKPDFDGMNSIITQMLLGITAPMRFTGDLNVDINEIATNLIPFPQLKFLSSSVAPLFGKDKGMLERSKDHSFLQVFHRDNQLVTLNGSNDVNLASAVFARGDFELSDVRRNIDKIKKSVKFPTWNEDAWKVGICDAPPHNQPYSITALRNNCPPASLYWSLGEARF
ncbi:hypothetical protein MP638_006189 [Amoeboaphelidium occidentale]|nr:hypothetical protein MP638_006189 [Amoeboaphelidium occidentale]